MRPPRASANGSYPAGQPDIQRAKPTYASTASSSGKYELPSAQYVTISAVLSRSGALYSSSGDVQDIFAAPAVASGYSDSTRNKGTSKARRRSGVASSGNALEAIGALLLHQDSKGRASSLSSQKWLPEKRRPNDLDSNAEPATTRSSSYASFLTGLKNVGTSKFGLHLPGSARAGKTTTNRETIAERRAQKRSQVGEGDPEVTFVTVRTKRNQPTFEVSRPTVQKCTSPLADEARPECPVTLGRSQSMGVYGVGSSFGLQHPPDAPPTPLAMPGDWTGGSNLAWSAFGGSEGEEDSALLLPPPLLDDRGSNASSFETLLGIRRAREQEEAKRRLQRLAARNRPAHKVGMMTALGNFVKAAHAADQATRAAVSNRKAKGRGGRPEYLNRRHTEPSKTPIMRHSGFQQHRKFQQNGVPSDAEVDINADAKVNVSPTPPCERSGRTSLEYANLSRSMDTVQEEGREPAQPASPSAPPVAASRRSSVALAKENPLFPKTPLAPRLLPIQMSGAPSPFTPLERDSSMEQRSGEDIDYISSRPSPSNSSSVGSGSVSPPVAPYIKPTVLSLPPSPWSFRGDGTTSPRHQQSFSLALSTSNDWSVPGTPRLVPTSLSVLPSPFPTAVGDGQKSLVGSPLALSATQSPHLVSGDTSSRHNDPAPLTLDGILSTANERRETQAGQQASDDGANDNVRLSCSASIRSVSFSEDAQSLGSDTATKRSFVLWWLLGDLGLGLQDRFVGFSSDQNSTFAFSTAVGFLWFCAIPLVDLALEIYESAAIAFWFLRWVFLNATGQTLLSRCVLDAYALVQAEWSLVALEDHEDRGRKQSMHQTSESQDLTAAAQPHQRPKGLTKVQVLRGFIELICLHAVTKDRWIRQGAGLKALEGWQKLSCQNSDSAANDDSSDEDDEEMPMIVTRREEDILEFTRTPRIRPKGRKSGDSSASDGGYFPSTVRDVQHTEHPTRHSRSLIRTLKWASRLAIGAYGLHVHIVDLPPTFTPSGERFNRQTFAHLSRLSNPEDVLHADIQRIAPSEDDSGADGGASIPDYQPTFYVARDHVRKMIVVAVRGTQSFSDIIADLDMKVERFPLHQSGAQGGQRERKVDEAELTCHAGVLRAAQGLLKSDSSLLTTVSSALAEHADFGLTFVGHSLGAAIASAIVMLIGEYQQGESGTSERGRWVICENSEHALPPGSLIQAISFAPPATFSAALSRRAARGATPLVTSVVLGADFIPRAGHGQARELRRMLGALARVRSRREGGDKVASPATESSREDARVHIFRSWWKWSSLAAKEQRARQEQAGPPLSSEEREIKYRIEEQLWDLRCDVESDLYSFIRGRASDSPNDDGSDGVPPTPWIGPHSSAPMHQVTERRQALDSATLKSEAKLGGVLIPAGRVLYISEAQEPKGKATEERSQREPHIFEVESPLSFFSLPEFTSSMFAAHLPSSYEAVIEEL
ncbi:unnamed protein product [Jaminaea pallidilutea]